MDEGEGGEEGRRKGRRRRARGELSTVDLEENRVNG